MWLAAPPLPTRSLRSAAVQNFASHQDSLQAIKTNVGFCTQHRHQMKSSTSRCKWALHWHCCDQGDQPCGSSCTPGSTHYCGASGCHYLYFLVHVGCTVACHICQDGARIGFLICSSLQHFSHPSVGCVPQSREIPPLLHRHFPCRKNA